MHDQSENTESALRREVVSLKAALEQAARSAEATENQRIAELMSNRDRVWAAEIERRRFDFESARAEVKLAEQLAIARHQSAETNILIERLKDDLEQARHELAEARHAYEIVMNSYSMAITKPLRALVRALRWGRR